MFSVAADLANPNWPQALQNAGFDTSLPSIWLLEGLVIYLPEQAGLPLPVRCIPHYFVCSSNVIVDN
jgi:O-methyltransferase involved in polyketide biosynthesis